MSQELRLNGSTGPVEWVTGLYGYSDDKSHYRVDNFVTASRVTAISAAVRSEEHTSELQSLMRISYAVFCLKKKKKTNQNNKSVETELYKHTTPHTNTRKK